MTDRPWLSAYDAGVPESPAFEERTVTQMLRRSAADFPDRIALRFVNAALSYRRLVDEIDRLAAGLAALGLTPGTRVAIHLPNLPQTVIAFHAVLSAGGVAVMTNPLYVGREIEHQWNGCGLPRSPSPWTSSSRTGSLEPIRDRLPVTRLRSWPPSPSTCASR